MKLKILFILVLFSLSLSGENISGYVIDKESGETIVCVNIFVEDTYMGAASDLRGFFIIRDIQPGTQTLMFSHISYKDTSLTLRLTSKDIYLERFC